MSICGRQNHPEVRAQFQKISIAKLRSDFDGNERIVSPIENNVIFHLRLLLQSRSTRASTQSKGARHKGAPNTMNENSEKHSNKIDAQDMDSKMLNLMETWKELPLLKTKGLKNKIESYKSRKL